MKIKKVKDYLAFILRVIIVLLCIVSMVINTHIMGIKNVFLYFTTLSNLGVLIFYCYYLITDLINKNKLERTECFYIFKGMATTCITLTMLVFATMVSSSMTIYKEDLFVSVIAHVIIPLLVNIDYIIFSTKGHLKLHYPIIWSLAIVVYTIICWIYKAMGGTFMNGDLYPYDYMNFQKYGFIKVMITCVAIYSMFVMYGYFAVLADCKRSNRRK